MILNFLKRPSPRALVLVAILIVVGWIALMAGTIHWAATKDRQMMERRRLAAIEECVGAGNPAARCVRWVYLAVPVEPEE